MKINSNCYFFILYVIIFITITIVMYSAVMTCLILFKIALLFYFVTTIFTKVIIIVVIVIITFLYYYCYFHYDYCCYCCCCYIYVCTHIVIKWYKDCKQSPSLYLFFLFSLSSLVFSFSSVVTSICAWMASRYSQTGAEAIMSWGRLMFELTFSSQLRSRSGSHCSRDLEFS